VAASDQRRLASIGSHQKTINGDWRRWAPIVSDYYEARLGARREWGCRVRRVRGNGGGSWKEGSGGSRVGMVRGAGDRGGDKGQGGGAQRVNLCV
jgi:hypothetical protein